MNTCYYYQDLLPWPVHGLATTRFNPTRVSALLVYTKIAQVSLLTRFIRVPAWYGYTG